MAMTLSRLVLKSMRKNIKHYYLYFFALIFSVTLCFSFTTLHNNSTVKKALEESGTATAGFEAATFVLYFIVTFFVLYANQLFMKRRSKEIGLYQLIGMTKGLIVRLIALENIILFVGAVITGMAAGYLSSRLFAMVLMRLLGLEVVVDLAFSREAFNQSLIIFAILLAVILLQIVWMIQRVSLLSLFNASKAADERVKRFSVFHMLMGIVGLLLIIYGYYESTSLFSVEDKEVMKNLYLNMLIILFSTILGTFLFFRYSVALILNSLRIGKKGHLKIADVLAVTPIMHRMKTNAKSLTLITVLTGLAVGISTLSYITYYSAETKAHQSSPYDYILLNEEGGAFLNQLQQEGIEYEQTHYQISNVSLNLKDLMSESLKDSPLFGQEVNSAVIPLSDFQQVQPDMELREGEALLTSYVSLLSEIMPLESKKDIIVKAGEVEIPLFITEIREDFLLSHNVTMGTPLIVVSDELFKQIIKVESKEVSWHSQLGINLVHQEDIARAEEIYQVEQSNVISEMNNPYESPLPRSFEGERKTNVAIFGTTIFITAFLGLAFLLTSGSILYFKQMAEAEEERESYTILRKIGFSTSDLIRGIYAKQAFNFGVPLMIGLLHSYFAVKSGWFLFGTELVKPLIIIASLYIAMYTIFAVLSTRYYKKVIKGSL